MRSYLLLWQLHSDFGDFKNGACHVVNIPIADSNPDIELLTQQAFCLSPDALARVNKSPIVTISLACDRGQEKQ